MSGRAGLGKTREAIASWGLGAWLLVALVFAGLFAAFDNGATSIGQESRL